MKNPGNEAKKVVLITGAAGGLGSSLVKRFAENGYRVIAVDIDPIKLSKLEYNEHIIRITADITSTEQVGKLRIESGLDEKGLDILICNAGIYDTYPVTEADPSLFRRMIEVNLLGTSVVVQGMLRSLVKTKGRVIVISSESYKVQALFQPYMISKASLEAYCKAARQELSLKGVKLSVVRPGAINTPLLKWMDSPESVDNYIHYNKELRKSWERSVKMVGRVATPERVAEKIYKVAIASRPKRVYLVNNNPLLFFIEILPGVLLDWLVKKLFNDT
jgi:NAD(P)-dependent dehydrogenase (short-subunit alcohol dehydrogenase family)